MTLNHVLTQAPHLVTRIVGCGTARPYGVQLPSHYLGLQANASSAGLAHPVLLVCLGEGGWVIMRQLLSQEIPFPSQLQLLCISSLVFKVLYSFSNPCSNCTLPLTGILCLGGLSFSLLLVVASHP